MRHYDIYLIEDEVAQAYFGEESKLFDLFSEARKTASSSQLQTVQKQIEYITKPMAVSEMDEGLKQALRHRRDYSVAFGRHLLKSAHDGSDAKLTFADDHIIVMAAGSFEAETIFFEVLRQMEPCLLAMDFHQQRYGWLNPIKQADII